MAQKQMAVRYFVLLLTWAAADPPNDGEVTALANAIREHLQLYQDVDATYTWEVKTPSLQSGDDPAHTIRHEIENITAAWQGPYYYALDEKKTTLFDGSESESVSEVGFDGKVTRLNDQGHFGNINYSRVKVWPWIAPQYWGCAVLGEHGVANFMECSESLRADPAFTGTTRVVNTILGNTTLRDRECVKLQCDAHVGDDVLPRSRYIFWIAPAFNYLTLRTEQYLVPSSLKLPIREYEITELREVAPGLWMPAHCEFRNYVDPGIHKTEQPVIRTLCSYTLNSIALDVNHPPEYFAKVEMPKNVPVYTIKGGKIVVHPTNAYLLSWMARILSLKNSWSLNP
jgi:hypothetical protein